MKTKSIFISLAAFLAISSCDIVELKGLHSESESSVTLCIELTDAHTRSSVGSSDSELAAFENNIVDLTLFRFLVNGSGETLDEATYYSSLSGSGTARTISVSGKEGNTYRYYALVNCGDRSSAVGVGSAPSALENIVVSGVTMASMESGGIPMVNRDGVSITFGTTTSATIPVTRMVARWDFVLNTTNLTHTSFSLAQLKLCQSPNRTQPFAASNAATSSSYVQDGDAATTQDLSYISSGNTVTFYVLENTCGELLPSNTNSWAKEPSSGTSVGGYYPTYIEMTGQLVDESGKLQRTSYYRMYLGENTTTNFDVERGTKYTLTFSPTEDPITEDISDEWKCELYSASDTRNFQFADEYIVVPPSTTVQFDVLNELAGYDMSYSKNPSSLNILVNGTSKTVMGSSSGTSIQTGNLYAYYWDGTLADQCKIIVGTTPKQPIGLCIKSSDLTITEGTSGVWVHDPDCPINHWVHDNANCSYRHYAVYDSGYDDYYSYDSCPYWHSDEDECQNKIYEVSGTFYATSEFTACLVTDFYVDSSGELQYGRQITSGVTITRVEFGTLADPDAIGYKTSSGGSPEIHFSNLSNGLFQWGAQMQSLDCQYFTITVKYNGDNYEFVIPISHEENRLANTVYKDQTPQINCQFTDQMRQFKFTGNTGVPNETFYIFANGVHLQNLTTVSSGNTFKSGDTVAATRLNNYDPSTSYLYVLNCVGTIVAKLPFS